MQEDSMTLYAGMDTTAYPGKPIMDVAWTGSNLYWTGMYLDSPAPVPGEQPSTKPLNGHNRMGGLQGNPQGSWMRAWTELKSTRWSGWGILPIYWGQQDPANQDGPTDLRGFIAMVNAEDAAAKARLAGIPDGAVIFLDWEIGGQPSQAGVNYCATFFHRLAELGFRPGMYCHPPSSLRLRQECAGLFVWNVNLRPPDPGDVMVVGGQVQLATPPLDAPGEPPDRDAIARQWRFGLGMPIPGFPGIDADGASVQNPSFPEQRNQPADIRLGPVCMSAADPDWAAVYAVRRGKPVRVTWSPGSPALDADLDSGSMPGWVNPFSSATALRPTANGVAVDWMISLGWEEANSDDAWRVKAFRHAPGGAWTALTAPLGDPALAPQVDPLPGVCAVARQQEDVEAFFVDRATRQIATTRWAPSSQTWTDPVRLAGAAGDTTTPVRLTNRIAVVSRAPSLVDVFWVGDDGLVRTSWSNSAAWNGPLLIGDPSVRAHPMANLAVVSRTPDSIDVLYVARRDGDARWALYDTWWSAADGWGIPPHTWAVGGTAIDVEPLARVAATSRTPDYIDAFVVGADGQLYNTFWDGPTSAWHDLRQIGGTATVLGKSVRLAAVDSACHKTAGDVDVLVTARNGSVLASHWHGGLSDYVPLEHLPVLDPT
jgi:hypothetical protein